MNRTPECPFCSRLVPPPRDLGFQFSDLDAGFCDCGAIYVSDVTGYNRGTAFAEALFLAAGGDWDLAWDLVPGEDYQEKILEPYDQVTHQIVPEGVLEGRKISGCLYFLKLAEDLRDLTAEKLAQVRAQRQAQSSPTRGRKIRRPEAERLVAENRREELLLLCQKQPLNLRVFQKLLYHPEPLIRFRTAHLLGELAQRLADQYPAEISDLVKRLLYASADSAASAWGALEAVGEIIARLPERFGLYVRNLQAFLKYPEFRPAALYGLWRIASRQPSLLCQERPFLLVSLLKDPSPEIKGLVLLILKALGLKELAPEIEPLARQTESFTFYDPIQDAFQSQSLGALTQSLLKEWQDGKGEVTP